MRVRFAPSPTGHLHIGNARTALFNWLLARGHGGTFILRIEDTDIQRSTPESETAIYEDLRWLGLTWDEGPDNGGPHGPYRQSERIALYHERAQALLDQGRAYFCFCSPEQLEAERTYAVAKGLPAKYSGRCSGIDPAQARARVAAGEQAAVRFRTPENREIVFRDRVRGDVRFHTDVIGDQILLRSDGHPAYNFAVVVDDALMGVTHVVRGEDHISNTPRQLLIYESLGLTPPEFAHLSLVLGPDHSPLAKRHGATSVEEFRAKGYLPEALVNYLALLGWSPGREATEDKAQELLPITEFAKRFSLDAVVHSASVFDEEKLAWVNRHYLKEADPTRLAVLAVPYLEQSRYVRAPALSDAGKSYLASIMPLISASVDRLAQVSGRLQQLFVFSSESALADPTIRRELNDPAARQVIEALAADLAEAPRLVDKQTFRAAADRVKQRTGQKGRALFHPIRLALTAASEGPELDLLVPAIDRGTELPTSAGIAQIVGCRERASRFAAALATLADEKL